MNIISSKSWANFFKIIQISIKMTTTELIQGSLSLALDKNLCQPK